MDSCATKVLMVFVVSFVLLQGVASVDDNNTTVATNVTVTTAGKDMNSSTPRILNDTDSLSTEKQNPIELRDTNGLLQRSLYVAIGISSIVAIYFIVRAVKTRGRRKAKKYGVIKGAGEMELQPLDKGVEEEEDEDMTLFDRKNTKWQA